MRKSARKDRKREKAAAAAPHEPWAGVTFRLVDQINSYNDDDCEHRLQWVELTGRRAKDAPDAVVDMAEFARLTEFARTTFDIDPELQVALRPQLPEAGLICNDTTLWFFLGAVQPGQKVILEVVNIPERVTRHHRPAMPPVDLTGTGVLSLTEYEDHAVSRGR